MAELDDILAKAEAADPPKQSWIGRQADRFGAGLSRIGGTIASGAGAAADALSSPTELLTNPSKRRELERGVDNMVTLGYGQKAADWVSRKFDPPETQLGATKDSDQQAAPGYRELGEGAGMLLPGASSLAGKLGGKLAGMGSGVGMSGASLGTRLLTGGARGVAGYEATAPALAGLSADASGNRLSSAADAATDPAGLLMSGGLGTAGAAAEKAVETAPGRVAGRRAKEIASGETNAKAKTARQVVAKAGEGGEDLDELLSRDPRLGKMIDVKAGSAPGKVAKAVAAKQGQIGGELDSIYSRMEKTGATVTPSDITTEFDKLLLNYKNEGDLPAIAAAQRARAGFLATYGESSEGLTADQLRGLKASAGKAAFPDMGADPTTKAKVQRDVWGAFSSAIERKAEGAEEIRRRLGLAPSPDKIDVARLRQLNSDMSILIPVHGALEQRATATSAGRPSMPEMFGHAAGMAAGVGVGAHEFGPAGALLGLAAPVGIKLGQQGARLGDWKLASKFGGVAPEMAAKTGARAGELEFAAKVSEGMKAGLSLEEALAKAKE